MATATEHRHADASRSATAAVWATAIAMAYALLAEPLAAARVVCPARSGDACDQWWSPQQRLHSLQHGLHAAARRAALVQTPGATWRLMKECTAAAAAAA